MRTVHKYPLVLTSEQVLPAPVNAIPLHVDSQNYRLNLWMEVDDSESMLARTVYIVGTGQEIPDGATVYAGSAILNPFVWHVYLSS